MIKKMYPLSLLLLFSCQIFGRGTESLNQTVILQTDRSCYVSGDLILLKLIQVPGKDSVVNGVVVYVDIVDKDGQFVNGEIFKLDKGIASGFLKIPDEVKTGYFSIRAYTYQSKNSIEQKKMESKQIFVTNRFNQTYEKYEGDLGITGFDNDDVYMQEKSDGNYLMSLSDTVFNKRSKVAGTIQFAHNHLQDTAWLALSVKRLSACESQLDIRNKLTTANLISNNKSFQKEDKICEKRGIILSGNVIDSITGKPLTNYVVFMAHQDSLTRLKYSITNEKGEFYFLLTDNYKKEVAYFTVYNYPQLQFYPQAKITVESKFLEKTNSKVENRKKVGDESGFDSLNVFKSVIAIAYDINLVDEQNDYKSKNNLFMHEFIEGEMTQTLKIDDYIELPDFIQIIKEILHSVRIEKNDKSHTLSVIDGDEYVVRKNPVVFVDGVPLGEISPILSWGSDKIKMVQVQSKPRYFGNVPFENGMIFIWTKKMDFWSKNESKAAYVSTLPCLQKPIKLSFPDYSKVNNRNLPDFRQILYWNPSIVIENNKPYEFEFYTSDEVGTFEVLMQGITKSNQPLTIRKYIHVK